MLGHRPLPCPCLIRITWSEERGCVLTGKQDDDKRRDRAGLSMGEWLGENGTLIGFLIGVGFLVAVLVAIVQMILA